MDRKETSSQRQNRPRKNYRNCTRDRRVGLRSGSTGLPEPTLDKPTTYAHVTSTSPWEIEQNEHMTSSDTSFCEECLISSCVNFSMTDGRPRFRSTNNQTIFWKSWDTEHMTKSTTLLLNSPCAHSSFFPKKIVIVCVMISSPFRGSGCHSTSIVMVMLLPTSPPNFHSAEVEPPTVETWCGSVYYQGCK